ncbi:hypothetical protein D3C84_600120 [compost metagenome]
MSAAMTLGTGSVTISTIMTARAIRAWMAWLRAGAISSTSAGRPSSRKSLWWVCNWRMRLQLPTTSRLSPISSGSSTSLPVSASPLRRIPTTLRP